MISPFSTCFSSPRLFVVDLEMLAWSNGGSKLAGAQKLLEMRHGDVDRPA